MLTIVTQLPDESYVVSAMKVRLDVNTYTNLAIPDYINLLKYI